MALTTPISGPRLSLFSSTIWSSSEAEDSRGHLRQENGIVSSASCIPPACLSSESSLRYCASRDISVSHIIGAEDVKMMNQYASIIACSNSRIPPDPFIRRAPGSRIGLLNLATGRELRGVTVGVSIAVTFLDCSAWHHPCTVLHRVIVASWRLSQPGNVKDGRPARCKGDLGEPRG
jgi:hypothetical protein